MWWFLWQSAVVYSVNSSWTLRCNYHCRSDCAIRVRLSLEVFVIVREEKWPSKGRKLYAHFNKHFKYWVLLGPFSNSYEFSLFHSQPNPEWMNDWMNEQQSHIIWDLKLNANWLNSKRARVLNTEKSRRPDARSLLIQIVKWRPPRSISPKPSGFL